jgi:hypothetical protein
MLHKLEALGKRAPDRQIYFAACAMRNTVGLSHECNVIIMTLGLGKKQKVHKEVKTSKKDKKSDSQADEAAEILKKMEAKKDDGECAFC